MSLKWVNLASLSQIIARDWRSYLWSDYDYLSGLPCGPKVEFSQKEYFAGKKRAWQVINPG